MQQQRLVHLVTVYGSFSAHVLVARLIDEGIDADLRGSVDSAYAFSVGELSRVDVFVPEDQLDDARLVLLDTEVESAFEPQARVHRSLPWPWWVVAAVALAATLAPLIRYFVVG